MLTFLIGQQFTMPVEGCADLGQFEIVDIFTGTLGDEIFDCETVNTFPETYSTKKMLMRKNELVAWYHEVKEHGDPEWLGTLGKGMELITHDIDHAEVDENGLPHQRDMSLPGVPHIPGYELRYVPTDEKGNA